MSKVSEASNTRCSVSLSSFLIKHAKESYIRCVLDSSHHSNFLYGNRYASESIAVTVLTVAALEAFINEFLAHSDTRRKFDYPFKEFISMGLRLKYFVVPRTLVGKTFDTKKAPFQDLTTLISLRNDIVHFKAKARPSHPSLEDAIPRYAKHLHEERLLLITEDDHLQWEYRICSVYLARWCLQTAQDTINTFLGFFHDQARSESYEECAKYNFSTDTIPRKFWDPNQWE